MAFLKTIGSALQAHSASPLSRLCSALAECKECNFFYALSGFEDEGRRSSYR